MARVGAATGFVVGAAAEAGKTEEYKSAVVANMGEGPEMQVVVASAHRLSAVQRCILDPLRDRRPRVTRPPTTCTSGHVANVNDDA